MIFNFGDQSAHLFSRASQVNRKVSKSLKTATIPDTRPYDYEYDSIGDFEQYPRQISDEGMNRTESLVIAASVVAAVLIVSSLVHAETVRDGLVEMPDIVYGVVNYPNKLALDLIVELNGIGL